MDHRVSEGQETAVISVSSNRALGLDNSCTNGNTNVRKREKASKDLRPATYVGFTPPGTAVSHWLQGGAG